MASDLVGPHPAQGNGRRGTLDRYPFPWGQSSKFGDPCDDDQSDDGFTGVGRLLRRQLLWYPALVHDFGSDLGHDRRGLAVDQIGSG